MREDDQEALLTEWRPFLLTVTRSVCRHHQDVDDAFQVAQIAFLKVYPKFPGGNIRGWMAIAVKRSLYGWFARQNRWRSREILIEDMQRLDVAQADRTEGALLRMVHDDWISRLPPPFAEAVILCIVDGLQQKRAAIHAGIPNNTMKSRLDRAVKRLRIIAADLDESDSECDEPISV